MQKGLDAYQATGAQILQPFFLALLAEAYGTRGQIGEGLAVLSNVLSLVEQHQERWWEAELYRLKGALLFKQPDPDSHQIEAWFHQALDIACHQQAKSLELRAATSLSRLWQQQGKREEARKLLADLYSWFTEGFETADLKEAKALLEDLS
jgi:predicted ATPase